MGALQFNEESLYLMSTKENMETFFWPRKNLGMVKISQIIQWVISIQAPKDIISMEKVQRLNVSG